MDNFVRTKDVRAWQAGPVYTADDMLKDVPLANQKPDNYIHLDNRQVGQRRRFGREKKILQKIKQKGKSRKSLKINDNWSSGSRARDIINIISEFIPQSFAPTAPPRAGSGKFNSEEDNLKLKFSQTPRRVDLQGRRRQGGYT
jgi:hypothetical protein